MRSDHWASVLQCSHCGRGYDVRGSELQCSACGTRYPVADGIPVLLKDSTIGTTLDDLDYDAVHGVTDEVVETTGNEWKELLDLLELEPEHALEIGAGTGVLTQGLLRRGAVQRLTATDVSHKFLRMLAERIDADPTPVALVACDANEGHFRAGSFDFVAMRSVLHHLLDYDTTIREIYTMLRPGGVAAFFEPVLQGKTVVSLLMALVLACDEQGTEPHLSDSDRKRIRKQIRQQTKSMREPQDRATLARQEDKYIFDIDGLRREALDAGFADAEFYNAGVVDPTYWRYVVQTMAVAGVAPETARAYRWLGEAFADTYARMFPDDLMTPMGFFVLRKGDATTNTTTASHAAPRKIRSIGTRQSTGALAASAARYIADTVTMPDFAARDVLVGSGSGVFVKGLATAGFTPRDVVQVDLTPDVVPPDAIDPRADGTFDLICVLEEFLHFGPSELVAALSYLRDHVRADGRLFFSVFIDELTDGGYGLADNLARSLRDQGDAVPATAENPPGGVTMIDVEGQPPLALYARQHLVDLTTGAGWRVDELRLPRPLFQHHLVCTPA